MLPQQLNGILAGQLIMGTFARSSRSTCQAWLQADDQKRPVSKPNIATQSNEARAMHCADRWDFSDQIS
jgi:hypothetical protein